MSAHDKIVYLNAAPHFLMQGALLGAIEALPPKVQKAPATQWLSTIKSLTNKGVKQAEIDDSEIVEWLAARKEGVVTRGEVLERVKEKFVTVKEVTLGIPKFERHSHKQYDPAAQYREVLFIANSERGNVEDRLEEIDWELEQFNFDLERLSTEPEAVFRLEGERELLMEKKKGAHDFSRHHFSDVVNGKHGKNLLAHGRELVAGNLFFVEEVQSDWGQQGRINDWRGTPKGPFVTDTKLWAGLVMRRMLQRAAQRPEVTQFAWIRGGMKNGGVSSEQSGLDEFYLKTMSSIVDKVIGKAGAKCRLGDVRIGTTTLSQVPMFDMTPEVRVELMKTMPLYSRSALKGRDTPEPSEVEQKAIMARAAHMLGSVKHVRLVSKLYDIATGNQVAGRYINDLAQASLNARDPLAAMEHECFHYAKDNLFSISERAMVEREFAPGTPLNMRVRDALLRNNDRGAAEQCDDADDAAAHGFTLWCRGDISLQDSPANGLFEELRTLVSDVRAWFKRVVLNEQCTTVEELFGAIDGGALAERKHTEQGSIRALSVVHERVS